jgi:protein O-mannosyl-transferase
VRSNGRQTTRTRFNLLLLLLPGWLAFMLYLPALSNGLVWDDRYFLLNTPNLRDPALWWDAIRHPLFVSTNYFRPLPLLSFVLETRLAGVTPFVYHMGNLLLHAANTTLVVLLARELVARQRLWLAALAGILFATHPVLVENVAWVSDRFDLMMLAFMLSALLAERRLAHPVGRAVTIALLFLAALLCKETAVVMLALLPLWQMLRITGCETWGQGWQRLAATKSLPTWLGLLFSLVLYLVLRDMSLGYLMQPTHSMMESGSLLQHALLIGKTVGWYAMLAIWPFGQLGPDHPAPTPVALSDGLAWLGLCSLAALLVWMLASLRRQPPSRMQVLILMLLVALSPVSNLVPMTIGDNMVQDRFLMMALVFAVLAVVVWIEPLQFSWRVATPAIAWLAAVTITVAGLIPHWQSNLTLWSWSYQREPDSYIGKQNYLLALLDNGRNEEVVRVAKALLRQGPQPISIIHNLALAEARLGHLDAAERAARKVVAFPPQHTPLGQYQRSQALNLLAYVEMQKHHDAEAERLLRRAIALTPTLDKAHYNLALLLYGRGQWEQGDRELDLAVRYSQPDMARSYYRQGMERRARMQAKLGEKAGQPG